MEKNYFIEVQNGKPQRRKRRKARIGCIEAEIAKTLSFIVDEKPVIVVMASDGRVNSSKSGKISERSVENSPRFSYNINVSLCSRAGGKNPRWQADTE